MDHVTEIKDDRLTPDVFFIPLEIIRVAGEHWYHFLTVAQTSMVRSISEDAQT